MINARQEIHFNRPAINDSSRTESAARTRAPLRPPILMDSVASSSVLGGWAESRGINLTSPPMIHRGRDSDVATGIHSEAYGSNLPIAAPSGGTIDSRNRLPRFRTGEAEAAISTLFPIRDQARAKWRIYFPISTHGVPNLFTALLTKSPTRRVLLPDVVTKDTLTSHAKSMAPQLFPTHPTSIESRKSADAEELKIHQELGHFSDSKLEATLKFGHCRAGPAHIQRIARRFNFQRGARRTNPPAVSIWVSRIGREIPAVDIANPFADVGPDGLPPSRRAAGRIQRYSSRIRRPGL